MIALLCFFLTLFASPLKSKGRLEAENAALRHQLIVLQRRVNGRVQLTNGDRLFLVMLYRWFPSVLNAITVIRPELWYVGIEPASVGTGGGIPRSWRPTEDRCGTARADPADERGKSSVGSAAHSWRVA